MLYFLAIATKMIALVGVYFVVVVFASQNYSSALVLPRVPKAVDDGQIMPRAMKDPQPANGTKKFTRHCMVFGNRHVFSVINTKTKEGDGGESESERESG
jgi:hypothetical protein